MNLDASVYFTIMAVVAFVVLVSFASPVFAQLNSGVQNKAVYYNNSTSAFANAKLGYQLGGLGYALAAIAIPLSFLVLASRRTLKTGEFAGIEDMLGGVIFICLLVLIAFAIVGVAISPAATANTTIATYGWANSFGVATIFALAPWLLVLGVGVLIIVYALALMRAGQD